jgi:HD-like signal output (HDOD) protein
LQVSIPVPPPDSESERSARRAEAVVCLSKLPPFHPAALKLLNISSETGTAMADFEQVFRSDPALTADLLLVANSALFGNRAKIASIRHALSHLGLDRVRSLASTIALSFFVRNQPRTAFVRHIWGHSIATAVIAEILGDLYGTRDMYTPGLVHDLGRLGLLLTVGPTYEKWISAELSNIDESTQLEQARFGMNHCEAGSLVGHKWGFPVLLRSCMIAHHGLDARPAGDPLPLVQLACRMADTLGFTEIYYRDPQAPPELPEKVRKCKALSNERIRASITAQIEVIGR